MEDGTLVIVLSTIGAITTIALYVVFPLPLAWKKIKNRRMENSESSFAVDIPVLMAVPVYCYNLCGVVYVVARNALLHSTPFHYACLMSSYMIGVDFLIVYFLIYMLNKNMRYEGLQELQTLVYGLFLNALGMGLVWLLQFMDTTTINMFTCILNTVLGIIMYASPLPVLMKRRKMETVQYFPLWISVLFFFNALAWFLVALVASPFDPYLLITNGVGAALGLVNFGIIVKSTWSTEIPRLLKSYITMIRERGLLYTIKSMMDVQVKETATELELNETAASEKDECIQVIVQ